MADAWRPDRKTLRWLFEEADRHRVAGMLQADAQALSPDIRLRLTDPQAAILVDLVMEALLWNELGDDGSSPSEPG